MQQPGLRNRVFSIFALDARSLALMRICLGMVLLVDLAIRASDFTAFYTVGGIESAARTDVWKLLPRWSLHAFSDSFAWQAFLFMLAALAACCLLVGWKTFWATFICWVLATSLLNYVPAVLNSGDILLRVLLFWSLFVPLGACWSLDARGKPAVQREICSFGSAALLLQLCLVYWCTFLFKYNPDWLSGNALQLALQYEFYTRDFAQAALQHPRLLAWASYGTLVLQAAGPFLLLIPWQRNFFRLISFLLFVSLHVGIELCLVTGIFSFVTLTYLLILLPFPGKSLSSTEIHEPPTQPSPFYRFGQWLAGAFFLYVLWWNLADLPGAPRALAMPQPVKRIGQALGLDQKWQMYSHPFRVRGWFVIAAQLEDGSRVDLLRHGEPINLEHPQSVAWLFPNHRWRTMFQFMHGWGLGPQQIETIERGAEIQQLRQGTADYFRRRWNETHPQNKAESVELILFRQEIGMQSGEEYRRITVAASGAPPRRTLQDALKNLQTGESLWP